MKAPEEIFKKYGALHKGHTEFRNGLHADGWIQKDAIVKNPVALDLLTQHQANHIKEKFSKVDIILGPVTGGALIASSVARHLNKEMGVLLIKQDPIKFHPMNIPNKEEKVIIVEDTISSGVDMIRVINFLKENDIKIAGISVWMNRKGLAVKDITIITLLKNPFSTYSKEDCPLCINGNKLEYADIRE